jgi:hypothetical protein
MLQMTLHACFKRMFQLFHLFSYARMLLQIFYLDVLKVDVACYNVSGGWQTRPPWDLVRTSMKEQSSRDAKKAAQRGWDVALHGTTGACRGGVALYNVAGLWRVWQGRCGGSAPKMVARWRDGGADEIGYGWGHVHACWRCLCTWVSCFEVCLDAS